MRFPLCVAAAVLIVLIVAYASPSAAQFLAQPVTIAQVLKILEDAGLPPRSWSSALDFGPFAVAGCDTESFVAVGAILDEPLMVSCGFVITNSDNLTCVAGATDTDIVSVRVCCVSALGCGDIDSSVFTVTASP